jgi:hypothetical protein
MRIDCDSLAFHLLAGNKDSQRGSWRVVLELLQELH